MKVRVRMEMESVGTRGMGVVYVPVQVSSVFIIEHLL